MRKMLKILCYQPCDEIEKAIKAADWKNSKWKGLDKYSNVYGSVDWEEGSAGLVWHKSCKVEICRERERESSSKHWTGKKNDARAVKQKFKLSVHLLLHAKCWNRSLEKSLLMVYERR